LTMGMQEFTKSGAFVAIVFVMVVTLLPFALEQIGEATELFSFPVSKTISGWCSFGKVAPARTGAVLAIDWTRYKADLESFTKWAEGRSIVGISLLPPESEFEVVEEDKAPERKMWMVPVVGCTAADPFGGKKGYVFFSGFDHPFEEGSMIAPTEELCGYEIVHVDERSVWLRAEFGDGDGNPMGAAKFPEFTRVDGDSLVRGVRRYVAYDAFPLDSGGWLMLDSFMPPDGAVFKLLDERRRAVTTLLCIVIGEKGGR